jgi:hypothetical protein
MPPPLNPPRPFDPAKVTNTSGEWCWMGLPRSILINGKGSYGDCEDVYNRKASAPFSSPFLVAS